ncbi:hypothetical protein [Paenibacillus sp. BK720]|uniref:hypothetical protein n=1 Tax=Paenibacillus sp. BK720 TaxID=2587092 RepID=UPI00141E9B74|nr:hypothetical protein [Paenibacillus sp. BK720]NIK68778.1 hypothetical protein [Paenibacillus sp. BK720]
MSLKHALNAYFDKYRLFKTLIDIGDDENQARRELVEKIDSIVGMLPIAEQNIIRERYLHPEADYRHDYEVYTSLDISRGLYVTRRDKAFTFIAVHLAIGGEAV